MMEQIPAESGHDPHGHFDPSGHVNVAIGLVTSIVEPTGCGNKAGNKARNTGIGLLTGADNPPRQRSVDDCPFPQASRDDPARDRITLIQEAISRGVPLIKIEEYLDWLDAK